MRKQAQRDGEGCWNRHRARLRFEILSTWLQSQTLNCWPGSSYAVNCSSGDHQLLPCAPQGTWPRRLEPRAWEGSQDGNLYKHKGGGSRERHKPGSDHSKRGIRCAVAPASGSGPAPQPTPALGDQERAGPMRGGGVGAAGRAVCSPQHQNLRVRRQGLILQKATQ